MFKKLLIPMIAVMAAVGLAFGMSAFTTQKTGSKIIEDYYLKAGMNAQDALTATNYQSTLPTGITCGGSPEVPCHYIFEPGDYATFQDFLNSKNTSSVVDDANETREQ